MTHTMMIAMWEISIAYMQDTSITKIKHRGQFPLSYYKPQTSYTHTHTHRRVHEYALGRGSPNNNLGVWFVGWVLRCILNSICIGAWHVEWGSLFQVTGTRWEKACCPWNRMEHTEEADQTSTEGQYHRQHCCTWKTFHDQFSGKSEGNAV